MADSKTQTPNVLARTLSVKLHRTVSPKAIRGYARERIARFGDDRYTAHLYTPAEVTSITAAFVGRGERSKAQTPKAKAKAKATVKATVKRTPRVHPMAGDATND